MQTAAFAHTYIPYAITHGLVRSVCKTHKARMKGFDRTARAHTTRPMLVTERAFVILIGTLCAPVYVPFTFVDDMISAEKGMKGICDREEDDDSLSYPLQALSR